jgi:hypothetical protein
VRRAASCGPFATGIIPSSASACPTDHSVILAGLGALGGVLQSKSGLPAQHHLVKTQEPASGHVTARLKAAAGRATQLWRQL